MCDDHTVREADEALTRTALTRRDFTSLATLTALTAALPRGAFADQTSGRDVEIETPDGTADGYFVHPNKGRHPAVLVWPDILSLRPAFRLMGDRLAEAGYAVLVVNPYYRKAKAPVVAVGESFQDAKTRERVLPLARSLTPATNVTDAKAFIAYLDAQGAVDKTRPIGTTGYCMGGPMTMRTAAAVPGRIGAGASFHGGGLVTDAEDSPHRLVPEMKAQYLFAIAENDDERQPEAKDELRKAFSNAGLAAEIEVYAGALHGWCPPDSRVYNEAQAERAWARLLALFERALV